MDAVKEETNTDISKDQTNILRLVLLLNEQGSFALKELLMYEVFNHFIQHKKIELQGKLSQAQFDELFLTPSCPHFSKISTDVLSIICTSVFGLPSIPKGYDVLLKSHLEGEGLTIFLSGYSDQIRTRKVLSKKQLGCLFPVVHFDKLDITLLSFLLFEIFSIKPTSLCFTKLPQQQHIQIGDDILRVRWYRNEVSHRGITGIKQEDFDSFWVDISGALIRLLGVEYKSRLDEIKTKCIDGPILSTYSTLIDQWHQEDVETRKSLQEIQQAFIEFKKFVGHRDYQHRIWWKSELTEFFKKVMREGFKNLPEGKQSRETSGQLQNALLFENREDMLRACHHLEKVNIHFKTHSGLSLARSASSVGSGSSQRKGPMETQTKELIRKTDRCSKQNSTAQKTTSSKEKRRWTGPVLFMGDTKQTTEGPWRATNTEVLCKIIQHTPTSSLDELSFHLEKNLQVHTPTSLLDAPDLEAMETCSVDSTVVDLPLPLRNNTRCRSDKSSRHHERRSNTQKVSNHSAPCTDINNKESDRYKRGQKLERRKLRKMEKENIDEEITDFAIKREDPKDCHVSRPGTPVPFLSHARATIPSKLQAHPSATAPHILKSDEAHLCHRQQNKRWITHPVPFSSGGRQMMNKSRRKSASDVHPGSFVSIQKQIRDRYGEEGLDFSEFTEKTLKQSGYPPIDETDEDCKEDFQDQPCQNCQNQRSFKPKEPHKIHTKLDMTGCTKGVMSALKGCMPKPSRK